MIDFFKSIGTAIQAFFQTLQYVFGNIHYVFESVGAALDIGVLFISLPEFIGGLAVITMIVAIVLLILRIFHG